MGSDSKEDIASQALARLGEPAISSFEDGTETADMVNQLYEPTILGLLSSYDWQFAQKRATLVEDGAAPLINEWSRAFALPTARTEIVGQPLTVWNTTALNAPAFFNWEFESRWIYTNATTIVIEYIERKEESLWPGYFIELAREALAAVLALPVTENASKEEWHTMKAFGSPSEQGMGGLWRKATMADERAAPTRSLLDDSDPMASARFSGSRNDGTW